MIKVKNVVIHWAEGVIEYSESYPKTFDTIGQANRHIYSNSFYFPATGGYDKHKFTVTWENGEEYTGRLDCKHYSCPDNDQNIGRHIKEYLEYLLSDEQYKEYHSEAKDMLDNYQLN